MNFLHFYVRRRKVIVPTVALTAEGFFIDTEPVSVWSIDQGNELKAALLKAFTQDNPPIPTPERQIEPGSAVLDAVGIKRWEAFEKGAALYTIHKDQRSIRVYVTGRGPDGMWRQDIASNKIFPADTPCKDVIDAVVDDIGRHPELIAPESTLPMIIPPSSEQK